MLIGIFYSQIVESSSLVSVLFREVFSHPYIFFFHLLVNDVSVIYIWTPALIIYSYPCSRCACGVNNMSNKNDDNSCLSYLVDLPHYGRGLFESYEYDLNVCMEVKYESSYPLIGRTKMLSNSVLHNQGLRDWPF